MATMQNAVLLGHTGTAQYLLRGAWVYRQIGNAIYRYDTLEGFVSEMLTGALGGSWKETQEGARLIDRFDTRENAFPPRDYVPRLSAKDRWEMVAGALEDIGADALPAPAASLAFVPRLRATGSAARG